MDYIQPIEQRIHHSILQHPYCLAQCQSYSRNSMFPLIKQKACILKSMFLRHQVLKALNKKC